MRIILLHGKIKMEHKRNHDYKINLNLKEPDDKEDEEDSRKILSLKMHKANKN